MKNTMKTNFDEFIKILEHANKIIAFTDDLTPLIQSNAILYAFVLIAKETNISKDEFIEASNKVLSHTWDSIRFLESELENNE